MTGFKSPEMPNKLCLVNGLLAMKDGSDVQDYLRSKSMTNADSVVLLNRADAQRLLEDARKWRALSDERFALAA
jgi:hypothetical protein